MARSRRDDRRSERRYVGGGRRRELAHRGFQSKSIRLPEGFNLFKVEKEGTKRLDFFCYLVGEGNPYAEPGEMFYERTFHTHRGVGPNNDTFCCLSRTAGKRCPICEHRSQLEREGADKDTIKNLRPKERQLYILKDLEDAERGYQIWDVSFYLFGECLDKRLKRVNNDPSLSFWDDFAHPSHGSTLVVDFEEKSYAGQAFYNATAIDFVKRRADYDEDKVLSEVPCLDELVIIPSYKELKAAYYYEELDDEAEESEETHSHARDAYEDEAPRRSRREEREEARRLEDGIDEAFERGRKPAGKREETTRIEHDDVPFDDSDDEEWD